MNPENRWIKLADRISWDEFEIKYVSLFPSEIGNIAKPLRMALGSQVLQIKFQYADRESVEQITEKSVSAVLYRASRLSGRPTVDQAHWCFQ